MTKQIYQVQISLQGSKPMIWRRILIHSDISLVDFHKIIQTVMGWTNSHVHQFAKGEDRYSPREFGVEDTQDSGKVKVNSLLKKENDTLIYEYDFGDSWIHQITLEKILPSAETVHLPVCIKGEGNCPPDDCGGILGYENLKAILANPRHEQYEEIIEWVGEEFDPDNFDRNETNEMLKYPEYGCY